MAASSQTACVVALSHRPFPGSHASRGPSPAAPSMPRSASRRRPRCIDSSRRAQYAVSKSPRRAAPSISSINPAIPRRNHDYSLCTPVESVGCGVPFPALLARSPHKSPHPHPPPPSACRRARHLVPAASSSRLAPPGATCAVSEVSPYELQDRSCLRRQNIPSWMAPNCRIKMCLFTQGAIMKAPLHYLGVDVSFATQLLHLCLLTCE
ncbi:hypothetical protein IWZ01DRAFT_82685 [Phyllosticta capitalensis]